MDLPDFSTLLSTCAPNVHQQTMTAIVKTESGFKPLAIGINKSNLRLKQQPATAEEAISTAKWLVGNGYNIDMGYAQINSANLKWLGMSIEDMFDECKNLSAGARILTDNYTNARKLFSDPQRALRAALSAYNTGNHSAGLKNGYVDKVSQNARPLSTPVDSDRTGAQRTLPRHEGFLLERSVPHPTRTRQSRQLLQDRAGPEFVYSRKTEESSEKRLLVYQ